MKPQVNTDEHTAKQCCYAAEKEFLCEELQYERFVV